MLISPLVSTTSGQESNAAYDGAVAVERVASDTYAVPGLATGLSQSGDVVLFGFDDGNVMLSDGDRSGDVVPLAIDSRVSHIEVRDAVDTAVVGWMDTGLFGVLDLDAGDGPLAVHPGLWDLDTTPDAERTVSVSHPPESTGSLGMADGDAAVRWETSFDDATGLSVAITDDANHVAVGAAHYWENGSDPGGNPGIRLYDGNGTELWRHDHGEDVLSVGVAADRELVVGGTDDGHIIVLDFEGNVVWKTDEYGGWLELSDDGGTLLVSESDGILYAFDAENGDERWTADLGTWAGEDISVSADGSRVFAADRGEAEFVIVENGETVWSASHDVGPGLGAIAGDGGTWSTNVTNLEEESSLVEVYRDPDAVTESEPAPEGGEDDPADGEEDEPDDDDVAAGPVSLELVDYYILGSDPNEEYITLRNAGDDSVDASGWTVRDRDGGRVGTNASPFEFPSGFTLEPGAEVTIFTGEGVDTADTLYWGYENEPFHIWREEGDVVTVLDADGEVLLEESIAADDEDEEDTDDAGPVSLELVGYEILGGEPDEEYITLQNSGDGALDMSNWSIEDDGLVPAERLSPFPFPSGFTLEPGAEVTIVTGDGNDTADMLHWGVGRQVWSEDGDIVYVLDADGEIVLEEPISAADEDPPEEEPEEQDDPLGEEPEEPEDTPDDVPEEVEDTPEETDDPAEGDSDEPEETPEEPEETPGDDPEESDDPPEEEPEEAPDEPADTPEEDPDDGDTNDANDGNANDGDGNGNGENGNGEE